jgi:hypothetical protein
MSVKRVSVVSKVSNGRTKSWLEELGAGLWDGVVFGWGVYLPVVFCFRIWLFEFELLIWSVEGYFGDTYAPFISV